MGPLLIDPHGDDAALFAAYTCLRTKPDVLVTHQTVPTDEVALAFMALDVRWYTTTTPTWNMDPTVVYAPAYSDEGHAEHNEAYELAQRQWPGKVVSYCTYAPRAERQKGEEVIGEPWMVARKLRALSCFVSQIEQESTRPWFTYLLDVREWLISAP